MITFFIIAELVDVNFKTGNIDVDTDTYEVDAVDEVKAIETLREQLEFRNEWSARGIQHMEVYEMS
jgi:hypothetical protein